MDCGLQDYKVVLGVCWGLNFMGITKVYHWILSPHQLLFWGFLFTMAYHGENYIHISLELRSLELEDPPPGIRGGCP